MIDFDTGTLRRCDICEEYYDREFEPEHPAECGAELEIDESGLGDWGNLVRPGHSTVLMGDALRVAGERRDQRPFTLHDFVDAMNEEAEKRGWDVEFIAHTSTLNGGTRWPASIGARCPGISDVYTEVLTRLSELAA